MLGTVQYLFYLTVYLLLLKCFEDGHFVTELFSISSWKSLVYKEGSFYFLEFFVVLVLTRQ